MSNQADTSIIDSTDSSDTVEAQKFAIIGLAGRFPGAANIHQFWANLCAGVEAHTTFSDETLAKHLPQELWQDPAYVKAGFVLDQVDHFDADFFAFTHRQAQITDPQQRIFLECVWEALEVAGIDVTKTEQRIGVYAGASQSTYVTNDPTKFQRSMVEGLPWLIGNDKDYLATQTAYRLNLRGPCMAIQSACSTGLVATHVACQSLLNYECDVAIAGAVTVRLPQERGYRFEEGGILAVDGHCRAFDAAATGTVFGNGAGVVVLKRLADALTDGDPIWAVIRGSAVNNDGTRKFNFTTSSEMGQYEVISEAWGIAGVTPDMITYVETHGTGTHIGDPIEVNTLASLFTAKDTAAKFCAIGSVKTNVGHLETAAGITGLIKTVLALHHRQIPPSLNYTTPNPEIDFAPTQLYVNTALTPWETDRLPRCAGVSSFGIGGTNAHIVLEEAPMRTAPTAEAERPYHLLTLSARNEAALRELAERYVAFLADVSPMALGDVCYTSHVGRAAFDHRMAVVGTSPSVLQQHLATYLADPNDNVGAIPVGQKQDERQVAFLFTGQGSQYVDMGRELYETSPNFRATLDRCDVILQECLGRSLLELLYPATAPKHNDLIESHPCAQAANFALECALADLWRSWGVQPAAVLGHSLGDFAAAYTAGVLSLEDGMRLVTTRGQLMATATGAMLWVLATENEVAPFLHAYADVAVGVISGPRSLVLSGGKASVYKLAEELYAARFTLRHLDIPVAAHSPLLDPVLNAFEAAVRKITLSKPQIPVVSSMTGQLVTDELTDPVYWRQQLRNTVRFADGVQTLYAQGCTLFLEIGPKPTLLGMAEQVLDQKTTQLSSPKSGRQDDKMSQPATERMPQGTAVQSAYHPVMLPSLRENLSDWQQMLTSLGELYIHGVAIDWQALDKEYHRHKVALPTYPFQRQRYWVDTTKQGRRKQRETALRPLVDRMLKLPQQKQIVFESAFSIETLPFLADHKVFDTVISPGACQLATILSGVDVAFATGTTELLDVLLPQALIIPTAVEANGAVQGAERTVQVILSPVAANGSGPKQEFTLLSFDPTNPEAEPPTHAMGYLATSTATPPTVNLAALQNRFGDESMMETQFTMAQTALGASFQWISHLWRQATDGYSEALGELHLPAVIEDFDDYLLHPGLLDACFQIAALATNEAMQETMLPFALGALHYYKPQPIKHGRETPMNWWCYATQVAAYKWDISLLDSEGTVLVAIKGFEARQATPAAVQHQASWRNWLYTVEWQQRPFLGLPLDYLPAPSTLINALTEQVAAQQRAAAYQGHLTLYSRLETLSIAYVLAAFAKTGFTFQVGQRWQLHQVARQLGVIPQHRRLLARLLALLSEAGILVMDGEGWRVVTQPAVADPQRQLAALQATYGNLPELRLLTRCGEQLSEVLRGVQEPLTLLFPGGNDETVRQLYTQSPVLQAGNHLLAQTIQQIVAQLPTGQGLRIVEIGAGTGSTTAALMPHLPATQTDYLFTDSAPTFLTQAQATFADYDFVRYQVLDIEQSPVAQGFARQQADLIVAANVLHATKDLGQTLSHTRQLLAPGGLLLLLEGTTPNGFTDLTFGLTDGWWRFADSRQDSPLLSADEWTTLLQAHGFVQVATTEIDGQAIIVAEVASTSSATASSASEGQPDGELADAWLLFADHQGIAAALAEQLQQQGKRALLVEAGLSYAQIDDTTFQIHPDAAADYQQLLATIPQVKQIVYLWSLDVPALPGTSDLLVAAQQSCGTVLYLVQALLQQRIEPAGLWLVTQAAQAVATGDKVAGVAQSPLWGMGKVIGLEHPELNCHLLDLDATTKKSEEAQATLLYAAINDNGVPAPMTAGQTVRETAFAVRNTPQGASCYVPRLTHVAVEATQTITILKEATYLITGGLSGVGLEIACWFAQQGAGHLILLGRSAPKAEIAPQLDQIRALGTQLTIAQVDVTEHRQLTTLLADIDEHLPLRGIIHSAGVLDDSSLLQHSRERFAKVLAPKVGGAWSLHELTQTYNLDFFVLFSSTAGLLGNWGQANHAAANAFLDAFAHYRQALGLPALSINWGAWSEVGAAAGLVRANQQQMETGGIGFITPPQGVASFAALLQQTLPQAGVLPINWSKYSQAERTWNPLYANLVGKQSRAENHAREAQPMAQHSIRQQLAVAAPAARNGLLLAHVQETVAKILGMATSPAAKVGFTELGLDSLMAIGLRRQLERSLQLTLPSTLAFEYPTSERLANYLLEESLAEFLPTAEAEPDQLSEEPTEVSVEAWLHKLEALLE